MASILLGRKRSYFSKSNFPNEDRFSELLIDEEETPFFTTCSEVPPHRRHMKKQVSFDSPPLKQAVNIELDESITEDDSLKR